MTTTVQAILDQMESLKKEFNEKHAGTSEAAVLTYALDNWLRIANTMLYTERLIIRDAFLQGCIYEAKKQGERKDSPTPLTDTLTEFDLWFTTKYTQ